MLHEIFQTDKLSLQTSLLVRAMIFLYAKRWKLLQATNTFT